jgi:hypothetical protein
MTAVDVFLIGALLVAPNASTHRYGAALLLLGVSGLGLLYGTLIYANSYAKIKKESDFTRQTDCGNIVSEALGVCPLVLSVPLALAAGTSSGAFAWSAFGASAVAFVVYQWSNYSLLGRSKHLGRFSAVTLSIVLFLLDAYGVVKLRSKVSTEVRFESSGMPKGSPIPTIKRCDALSSRRGLDCRWRLRTSSRRGRRG